jgi:hypothetical protein
MKFKSFLVDNLKAKQAEFAKPKLEIADLKEAIEVEKANQKIVKASLKAQAAAIREEKRLARIAKLEAKLAAAKAPKTGIAAKKASRKPGPVTVIEVNA